VRRRRLIGCIGAGRSVLAGCSALPENEKNVTTYDLSLNNDFEREATVTLRIFDDGTELYDNDIVLQAGGYWELDEDFEPTGPLTVEVTVENGPSGSHEWRDPELADARLVVTVTPGNVEFGKISG
jgi:hypothetical protein